MLSRLACTFVVFCAYQVAAACDQHRLWLAADVANQCCEDAAQSGKDGSHDNTAEGKASSEHSHGSLHRLIREDEADAQVLALDKLLLSEVSSDETHKDYDGTMAKDGTCQDHILWPPPAALDPFNYTDNDLGYSSLRVHTAEGQWEFLKQMARKEGAQTHPGLRSDEPNKSIDTTGMQSTIVLDDTEFHKHGTEDMDPCDSHSTNGNTDEIKHAAQLPAFVVLQQDPVGEPATPEGLLHKAGWAFISSCRLTCNVHTMSHSRFWLCCIKH